MYDFNKPVSNKCVIIIHGTPRINPRQHIQTNRWVMCVANNLTPENPSKWISKRISTSIQIIQWNKLIQSLPRKIN